MEVSLIYMQTVIYISRSVDRFTEEPGGSGRGPGGRYADSHQGLMVNVLLEYSLAKLDAKALALSSSSHALSASPQSRALVSPS